MAGPATTRAGGDTGPAPRRVRTWPIAHERREATVEICGLSPTLPGPERLSPNLTRKQSRHQRSVLDPAWFWSALAVASTPPSAGAQHCDPRVWPSGWVRVISVPVFGKFDLCR